MRTAYQIVCPNCVSNHQIISKLFVHIVCCMINLFFFWGKFASNNQFCVTCLREIVCWVPFFCTNHRNICAPVEFFAHVPFCTGRFSPKLALLSMCDAVCVCVCMCIYTYLYIDCRTVLWERLKRLRLKRKRFKGRPSFLATGFRPLYPVIVPLSRTKPAFRISTRKTILSEPGSILVDAGSTPALFQEAFRAEREI